MLPKLDWDDPQQVESAQRQAKTALSKKVMPHYKKTWKDLTHAIAAESETIQKEIQQYGSALPEITMQAILAQNVPTSTIERILNRGAAVIRGVYNKEQITAWYEDLAEYVTKNKYDEQTIDPNLDQYFSGLDNKKPQIYNIYWSKTQMNIRQHQHIAAAKSFLNHLWQYEVDGVTYFDPDKECIYADRFRMRQPGDTQLGLSPHIDGGSVERWLDDANKKIYDPIFSGNWQSYNPFNGAYRNQVENIPSPAVCRAFRTYQGWVALTAQGPGDGTLQLIPMVKQSTAFLLLRPFAEDINDHTFCGAEPARAQAVQANWHQPLLDNLISIPYMHPGDTVWWHHDLIHAVEKEHHGAHPSSVTYVGSAPLCERNQHYLELQKPSFLAGLSSPDFAPEHREKNYTDRCLLANLTLLGQRQMGFAPW